MNFAIWVVNTIPLFAYIYKIYRKCQSILISS